MNPQEIKEQLKLLIEATSTIDPRLAIRLNQIHNWIKDLKPGKLISKRFVILFLLEILTDADAWIKFQSLPSDIEKQSALDTLSPTLKYWYGDLFPRWLNQEDKKFYMWRRELMAGNFNQEDAPLIDSISKMIKQDDGTVVKRYIADLSMATDIIVSGSQNKPLCVQVTSLAEEFLPDKFTHWQDTLIFWQIERGLFLSYNPKHQDFVNQIVKTALDNSNHLNSGSYHRLIL
ncbi:hypothetical protein B6N60_00345 [Richelia sinica FACHB-800]|uniref:Uncharacterized protein n=1 Tax=Richelia sinica FACHB-800 TaxID=1357546 RepID=A0A975T556_9NOST|nr:hypothetical protein [Richelia sinica]MBD2667424.1 hypothetical protein [Richelia sinica FACHB-800]QXE21668.1 hypothetical protein B6N60_00345 [Richelia sinica FACHB-800]